VSKLTPEQRKQRRKERRERWGGPVPPWLRAGGQKLITVGQQVGIALVRIAIRAVFEAAAHELTGEQKHGRAVDRVLEDAYSRGVTMAREEAAGLVFDVYTELEQNGEID
jgi:hypothetical protein